MSLLFTRKGFTVSASTTNLLIMKPLTLMYKLGILHTISMQKMVSLMFPCFLLFPFKNGKMITSFSIMYVEHFTPLMEQISKLEEVLYNIQFEQHWFEAQIDRQEIGRFEQHFVLPAPVNPSSAYLKCFI